MICGIGPDADALEFLLHAADRPEKIHGRGPGLADEVTDLIEVTLQVAGGFGFGIAYAERDAHGGGNSDRRRPAHHHIADDIGHLLVRGAGDIDFFRRQLRLIDEAYALIGPFKSLNHKEPL